MIEPPWVGRRLYLVAAEKQSEATVDQVSVREPPRARPPATRVASAIPDQAHTQARRRTTIERQWIATGCFCPAGHP